MTHKTVIVAFTGIINRWMRVKMSENVSFERREESVTLNRGMQGKYGWEIKVFRKDGEHNEELVERIKILDQELRESFVNLNKTQEVNK